MNPKITLTAVLLIINIGCKDKEIYEYDLAQHPTETAIEELTSLKLPPGFRIEIYAENIKSARGMEYDAEHEVLYVSTYPTSRIYALKDFNNDNKADRIYLVADLQNIDHRIKRYLPSKVAEKIFPGLLWPNGIAFINGDLYVAEPYAIKRIKDVHKNLGGKPEIEIIFDKFPMRSYHGWRYLNVGPDGKLYITNGSTCDACIESDTTVATICRMDIDGSNYEVYAKGVRNTMGFTWHPITRNLWFSDNGADHLGDEAPPDEINMATHKGQHFGWPYLHGNDIEDITMEEEIAITTPKLNLTAHTAPLGIQFYTGDMFPPEYKNRLFICEHGSRYRQLKEGYRIAMVELDSAENIISYEPFIEGWLKNDKITYTDRPVDIEELPDGSILISSDYSDKIFRVSYDSSLVYKSE